MKIGGAVDRLFGEEGRHCVKVLWYLVILLIVTADWSSLRGGRESPTAQESASENEILSIEAQKNEAMEKGDTKTLEQVYDENLLFINAKGKLLTKQDRIREYASGDVKYSFFRQGDYRVRVYGDTAIVTGASCSVVEYRGKANRVPRRFTSVYIRLNSHWR